MNRRGGFRDFEMEVVEATVIAHSAIGSEVGSNDQLVEALVSHLIAFL